MSNKSMPDESKNKKPKKPIAVPKSISQTFYEKYAPIINKASKELGSRQLGGYAGLLKAKRDDPNLFNRIIEITDKKIAMKEEAKKKRNADPSHAMNTETNRTKVNRKSGGKVGKRKTTKSVSGHNRLY